MYLGHFWRGSPAGGNTSWCKEASQTLSMFACTKNTVSTQRSIAVLGHNQLKTRATSLPGPIVRVGPNRYSISLPSGVKTIYELGGKYSKTDYYKPLLAADVDKQNIFTIQNNDLHKERRRKIASLYTMSSMVSYEKAVDEMTSVCVRKMHEFAEQGRMINIPQWLQYYAFDVIGEITVRCTCIAWPPLSPY